MGNRLHFRPDKTKSYDVYAEADFSGNYKKEFAHIDPPTVKSRSSWIIIFPAVLLYGLPKCIP